MRLVGETKREKVKLRRQDGEGLASGGKTVKLKGKKAGAARFVSADGAKKGASKKKKKQGGFARLAPDDFFRGMAAGLDDGDGAASEGSVSVASSASSMQKRSGGTFSGYDGGLVGGKTVSKTVLGAAGATRAAAPPRPASVYSDSSSHSMSSAFSSRSSASSVRMDRTLGSIREEPPEDDFGMTREEEEEAEKQDILARLHTMKQRGVRLSKAYTARSTLPELRMEIGRIEHEHETERSVQRLRRWLMMLASGAQFASNSRYAPKLARGRLDGFSNYVLNSIEDYDPAFEAMSERYSNVIGVGSTGNPLYDVAILFAMQMFLFLFVEHRSSVKPPTEDEVREKYPDLVNRLATERMDKLMRERAEQEQASVEAVRAQREEERRRWMELQAQSQDRQDRGPQALAGFQRAPMAPPPRFQPQLQQLQQAQQPQQAQQQQQPQQRQVWDYEQPEERSYPLPAAQASQDTYPNGAPSLPELPVSPEPSIMDFNTEGGFEPTQAGGPVEQAHLELHERLGALMQAEARGAAPFPFPDEALPSRPLELSRNVELDNPVFTRAGRKVETVQVGDDRSVVSTKSRASAKSAKSEKKVINIT